MLNNLKKLVRRAFPGFPDFHVPRVGEVAAITDASVEAVTDPAEGEKATDRFRPRYAVDVQLLTPQGQPDAGMPILKGLPLPAFGAGPGRGLFAFPALGARVLLAFAYGLPTHPYIINTYPEGGAVPALGAADFLIQQQEGAFLRFDAKGNATLNTDGRLSLDAETLDVWAAETSEWHGKLTRSIDGDLVEEIGGRLLLTVLGALVERIGGDARRAVLGGEETTVAGDRSELVGGKAALVAGQGLTFTTVLGDLLLEAKAGDAQVVSTLGKLLLKAAQGVEILALPGGKIKIGNGVYDLLAIVDAFLNAAQEETHGTGVGPSTPPTILADYLLAQLDLMLIKE